MCEETDLYEAHCRLPRSRRSVPRARAMVRIALDAWEADPGTADDAELVVAELVTNALRAPAPGDRQVVVRVRRPEPEPDGATVRLEVSDAGEGRPQPRVPASGDEGGYGLLLVDALAHRWGTQDRASGIGKTVWAELRAEATPAITVRPGQRVRARGAWRTVLTVRSERYATGGLAVVLGLDEGPALRVPAAESLSVRGPGRDG